MSKGVGHSCHIARYEREKLSPDNFETSSLLRAVDDLRCDLNDGGHAAPQQIRTDLLRLHRVAMDVLNGGSRNLVPSLFEPAGRPG